MASTPKGLMANPAPSWAFVRMIEAGTIGPNTSDFNKTPLLGATRTGAAVVQLGDLNEPLQDLAARDEYLYGLVNSNGQVLSDPRAGIDRMQSFGDLIALSAVTGSRLNTTVTVDNSGVWRCDPTSNLTIDGFTVIARAGGGRWIRTAGNIQLIATAISPSTTFTLNIGQSINIAFSVPGALLGDLCVVAEIIPNALMAFAAVTQNGVVTLTFFAIGSGAGSITATATTATIKVFRFQ